MNIFWELHSGLPQQGPGSDEATLRALSLIPDLPNSPVILDVGCGPGRQTVALAARTGGTVTALDIHKPFLDEVRKRSGAAGIGERVITRECPMENMDFAEGSFDLIWSEGAIYVMGFENGLKYLQGIIKPGGFIVVSEISWLVDNPPDEVAEFWNREYPDIVRVDQNMETIERLGYIPVTSFALPDSAWFDGYYDPLEKRIDSLRHKYSEDDEALEFLDDSQKEIDIFRRYSSCYGYVFYIMRKPLE